MSACINEERESVNQKNVFVKVFIIGCGRSGTTLLRTILNHHSKLFIPTESLFILDYLKFGNSIPPKLCSFMLKHEPQFKIWFNSELPLIKVNTNFCQFFNQVHEMEMVKKKQDNLGAKNTSVYSSYRLSFRLLWQC